MKHLHFSKKTLLLPTVEPTNDLSSVGCCYYWLFIEAIVFIIYTELLTVVNPFIRFFCWPFIQRFSFNLQIFTVYMCVCSFLDSYIIMHSTIQCLNLDSNIINIFSFDEQTRG